MAADPRFAIGRDGTINATPANEYLIHVHAGDGSPLRDIAADVRKIPTAAAEFQKKLDDEIAAIAKKNPVDGSESFELLATLRRDGAKPGHADHRPILGRIIASREGSLLVERLDLDPRPHDAGDTTRWDYLTKEGKIAGRFVTPPKVFPRLLDGQKIFAVVRDENDVPQIVRYSIAR